MASFQVRLYPSYGEPPAYSPPGQHQPSMQAAAPQSGHSWNQQPIQQQYTPSQPRYPSMPPTPSRGQPGPSAAPSAGPPHDPNVHQQSWAPAAEWGGHMQLGPPAPPSPLPAPSGPSRYPPPPLRTPLGPPALQHYSMPPDTPIQRWDASQPPQNNAPADLPQYPPALPPVSTPWPGQQYSNLPPAASFTPQQPPQQQWQQPQPGTPQPQLYSGQQFGAHQQQPGTPNRQQQPQQQQQWQQYAAEPSPAPPPQSTWQPPPQAPPPYQSQPPPPLHQQQQQQQQRYSAPPSPLLPPLPRPAAPTAPPSPSGRYNRQASIGAPPQPLLNWGSPNRQPSLPAVRSAPAGLSPSRAESISRYPGQSPYAADCMQLQAAGNGGGAAAQALPRAVNAMPQPANHTTATYIRDQSGPLLLPSIQQPSPRGAAAAAAERNQSHLAFGSGGFGIVNAEVGSAGHSHFPGKGQASSFVSAGAIATRQDDHRPKPRAAEHYHAGHLAPSEGGLVAAGQPNIPRPSPHAGKSQASSITSNGMALVPQRMLKVPPLLPPLAGPGGGAPPAMNGRSAVAAGNAGGGQDSYNVLQAAAANVSKQGAPPPTFWN